MEGYKENPVQSYHGPEVFDDRMSLVVTAGVIGVGFEVVEIDGMRSPGNDDLMLVVVEHPQPLQVHHVRQPCVRERGREGGWAKERGREMLLTTH